MTGEKDENAPETARRPGEDKKAEPMMENKTAPASDTIDRWFDAQLGRLYGEVADEPLPRELLDLIEKLKAKRPQG